MPTHGSFDRTKPKDVPHTEADQTDTVAKPGGFQNDPNDPKNPNEVRERHLKKVKQL
jgi:hypothetical protein